MQIAPARVVIRNPTMPPLMRTERAKRDVVLCVDSAVRHRRIKGPRLASFFIRSLSAICMSRSTLLYILPSAGLDSIFVLRFRACLTVRRVDLSRVVMFFQESACVFLGSLTLICCVVNFFCVFNRREDVRKCTSSAMNSLCIIFVFLLPSFSWNDKIALFNIDHNPFTVA